MNVDELEYGLRQLDQIHLRLEWILSGKISVPSQKLGLIVSDIRAFLAVSTILSLQFQKDVDTALSKIDLLVYDWLADGAPWSTDEMKQAMCGFRQIAALIEKEQVRVRACLSSKE